MASRVDRRKLLDIGDERNGRNGFEPFAVGIIIAGLAAVIFAALLLAIQFVGL
jgi:hypothetical protein